MPRRIALALTLLMTAISGLAVAADKPIDKSADRPADRPTQASELARLAGEYGAEFLLRTGQAPADPEVLKSLTLKIAANDWTQTFRGDVASYTITLDPSDDMFAMQLTHKMVKAARRCTYVLKADSLAVTEQLGEPGEMIVTIWKRKRPIN